MGNPQQASQRLMASIPPADKEALYSPDNVAIFIQSLREGYRPGWQGVAQDDIIINQEWGFDLRSIRVPVDIWHGLADVNVPISGGRYLASVLPNARPYFLPDKGHFFVLQHWSEVLASLISNR